MAIDPTDFDYDDEELEDDIEEEDEDFDDDDFDDDDDYYDEDEDEDELDFSSMSERDAFYEAERLRIDAVLRGVHWTPTVAMLEAMGSVEQIDLTNADLRAVEDFEFLISGAILTNALLPDWVPTVPKIHSEILKHIDAEPRSFYMGAWHSDYSDRDKDGNRKCGTTHCYAGWATALAGHHGSALEETHGTPGLGGLILVKSAPLLNGIVPDFYADDTDAYDTIKSLAEQEQAGQ